MRALFSLFELAVMFSVIFMIFKFFVLKIPEVRQFLSGFDRQKRIEMARAKLKEMKLTRKNQKEVIDLIRMLPKREQMQARDRIVQTFTEE